MNARRNMSLAALVASAAAGFAACGFDTTVLSPNAAPSGDAGTADVIDDINIGEIVPVKPTGDVFTVAVGQYSSCALGGSVAFCWGDNAQGTLGTGDRTTQAVPSVVAGNLSFDAISVGEYHTCGLERETHRVHCWGSNIHGQLGVGDKTVRLVPTAVTLPERVKVIDAGYQHSCAVGESGALYCWGDNGEGQLGLDEPSGAIFESLTPARVGAESDWTAVAGGQGHTCALRGTRAWCWGRNTDLELGLGSGQPGQIRRPTEVLGGLDFSRIDSGQGQSCAITTAGELHCWGSATGGNLDGSESFLGTPTRIGTASDWTSVSVDVFQMCATAQGDRLYCWGRNAEGQLGVGDSAPRAQPTQVAADTAWAGVSVGRFHVCAMSRAHVVSCMGANDHAQLGTGDADRRNTPSPVTLPLSITRGM